MDINGKFKLILLLQMLLNEITKKKKDQED